jgi:hypothetical protein
MSRLTAGGARIWSWAASNKDQLGVVLSFAALALSLMAINEARKTQSVNEQIEKAQLQPIFLVSEIEEEEEIAGPDGKQEEVTRTALRVVNRGHEVTCVRVKAVTIVPALVPALALNDITEAARIPAPLLTGGFGISDYYPIEDPDRCLQEVTGVLVDTPRTGSRWLNLARRNINILALVRAAEQQARSLDDFAGNFDPSSEIGKAINQRSKLDPLIKLLPRNFQSFPTTYVEVSYRDILGKDHVSYFKLPGDGLPIDQKTGRRCLVLYDQLVQDGRSEFADSQPTLTQLQGMSPDPALRSEVSC